MEEIDNFFKDFDAKPNDEDSIVTVQIDNWPNTHFNPHIMSGIQRMLDMPDIIKSLHSMFRPLNSMIRYRERKGKNPQLSKEKKAWKKLLLKDAPSIVQKWHDLLHPSETGDSLPPAKDVAPPLETSIEDSDPVIDDNVYSQIINDQERLNIDAYKPVVNPWFEQENNADALNAFNTEPTKDVFPKSRKTRPLFDHQGKVIQDYTPVKDVIVDPSAKFISKSRPTKPLFQDAKGVLYEDDYEKQVNPWFEEGKDVEEKEKEVVAKMAEINDPNSNYIFKSRPTKPLFQDAKRVVYDDDYEKEVNPWFEEGNDDVVEIEKEAFKQSHEKPFEEDYSKEDPDSEYDHNAKAVVIDDFKKIPNPWIHQESEEIDDDEDALTDDEILEEVINGNVDVEISQDKDTNQIIESIDDGLTKTGISARDMEDLQGKEKEYIEELKEANNFFHDDHNDEKIQVLTNLEQDQEKEIKPKEDVSVEISINKVNHHVKETIDIGHNHRNQLKFEGSSMEDLEAKEQLYIAELEQEDELHGDEHNSEKIKLLEAIEKDQEKNIIIEEEQQSVQDEIKEQDEKDHDDKGEPKKKQQKDKGLPNLTFQIGVDQDNNELFETVDNGITKTMFRAKTMDELERKEKEFLDDFQQKVADRKSMDELTAIKNAAAKAEMDKTWISPVSKYERTRESNAIFQRKQQHDINAALKAMNDHDMEESVEDDDYEDEVPKPERAINFETRRTRPLFDHKNNVVYSHQDTDFDIKPFSNEVESNVQEYVNDKMKKIDPTWKDEESLKDLIDVLKQLRQEKERIESKESSATPWIGAQQYKKPPPMPMESNESSSEESYEYLY